MKVTATVLVSTLLAAGAATGALGDSNSAAYARARALSAAHQPSGKPTKASSFAPTPGGSHRHVYGAPIQGPILGRQAPKKPNTQAASTSSARLTPTSTSAAPK